MPAPHIPERQPIGDTFTGVIIKVEDYFLLSDSAIDKIETTHEGTFTVRYGVVFPAKPDLSIVPALLALDYGEFKTGEDAWDFLLNKSTRYPRADVIGHNNSGEDAQAFVRELDLMYPFDILVYENDIATTPLCKIDAIISKKPDATSERLAEYVNIFPTIKEWKKALS